jgi:predicted Rdx family selenoprotein
VRAASLAAELSEAGHEASIEEGGKGQFDVLADGDLVFSKKNEGRFPGAAELDALLSARR